MIEQELPARLCPNIDTALPTRAQHRSERQLATVNALKMLNAEPEAYFEKMERLDPNLPNERKLRDEPKAFIAYRDTQLPSRTTPIADSVLPKRATARIETDDPTCRKSKVERHEPCRSVLLRDTELPHCK
jgi:hypothetical protein